MSNHTFVFIKPRHLLEIQAVKKKTEDGSWCIREYARFKYYLKKSTVYSKDTRSAANDAEKLSQTKTMPKTICSHVRQTS